MGIGYGIAYRPAEAGANLVIADLDGQAAEDAAADLVKAGFEATATQTNVAEVRDVERMVAASTELYGDIDILVNNPGVYPNILVMNMETDDFARVLNVNLLGVSLCTGSWPNGSMSGTTVAGSSTSPPSMRCILHRPDWLTTTRPSTAYGDSPRTLRSSSRRTGSG